MRSRHISASILDPASTDSSSAAENLTPSYPRCSAKSPLISFPTRISRILPERALRVADCPQFPHPEPPVPPRKGTARSGSRLATPHLHNGCHDQMGPHTTKPRALLSTALLPAAERLQARPIKNPSIPHPHSAMGGGSTFNGPSHHSGECFPSGQLSNQTPSPRSHAHTPLLMENRNGQLPPDLPHGNCPP